MDRFRPTGPDVPPRVGGWGDPGGGGGAPPYAPMPGGGGLPYEPPPAGGGTLLRFPPDYFPPPSATDFNPSGFKAGQTVADGVFVLATYQLPQNEQGVIRSVSVGVGNFDAAGLVLFAFRAGGMPMPGWGAIDVPPQAATFAAKAFGPDETRILIPFGSIITLTAQVVAGGPYDMYSSAHGWSWGGAL